MKHLIYASLLSLCLLAACREDEVVRPPVEIPVTPPDSTSQLLGFYLLNEGNMGTNKATLDFFNFVTGNYHQNIYGNANPNVPMELGDVGNDLAIYGSRLYAVINCSNKIEVMNKFTARRLGQINIPNCRYIRFHEGYAYVTSYAGPVEINPDYEQRGYVAKVDTATFQVVAQCLVGFQPNGLEIVNGKIYVANSGGYMTPNYEKTVSVIDMQSFTETKRIEVAINLSQLEVDNHGTLWVTSSGNHGDIPPRLHWIDTQTDSYGGTLHVPAAKMTLTGDSIYFYGSELNNDYEQVDYFGIVDVTKKELMTKNFLANGAERKFEMPYGIMVNPINKDIYLTDAANRVVSGRLYCFDRNGNQKWEQSTGDVPAHFAILCEP